MKQKLSKKRTAEWIAGSRDLPMHQVKTKINDLFENWMAGAAQTDDVVFIGLEL